MKQLVALVMGYQGAQYSGMQRNPNSETIEKVLFEACIKAGLVDERNADDADKVSLLRSCRTDKGVSAAHQVVSLKLEYQVDINSESETLVSVINGHLPADIRIFKALRTTNSFNPKTYCESRTYEYLIPSWILDPLKEEDEFFRLMQDEEHLSKRPKVSDDDAFEEFPKITEEEQEKQNLYRVSDVTWKFLGDLCQEFVGTHSFHNFTIGKSPSDQNAKRFIKACEVDPAFVSGNKEFIMFRITGGSFLLHQIRKMVGLLVLCCKITDMAKAKSLLRSSFSPSAKYNIPKVPGEFLYLRETYFPGYNKKVAGIGNTKALPIEPPEKDTALFGLVESFRKEMIISKMISIEMERSPFWNWWKGICKHTYNFAYLKSLL